MSSHIQDHDWNFIWMHKIPPNLGAVELAKTELRKRKRELAIWIPSSLASTDLLSNLKLTKKISEETWFTAPIPETKERSYNFHLERCDSEESLKIFLDIFYKAYGGTSKREAYGTLPPTYGECWKLAFYQSGSLTMYIVRQDEKPIACLALGIHDQNVGIYGLGVVPEARGGWLWRNISLAALDIARSQDAKVAFAATTSGSANEKLYIRAGMCPVESASCWC